MANVKVAIAERLLGIPAITNLVGTRVFGGNVIDRTKPHIRITTPTIRHESHLTGATGFAFATVQIDSVADTEGAAEQLANEIRDGLDGYQGTAGNGSRAVVIRSCNLQTAYDDFVDHDDNGSGGYHYVTHRYEVGYQEAIPTGV